MATTDAHYDRSGIGRAILDGLRAAGADPQAPTPDDLAPVDDFHTRCPPREPRPAAPRRARSGHPRPRRRRGQRRRRTPAGERGRLPRGPRPYRGLRRGGAGSHATHRLDDRVDLVHADALAVPEEDGAFGAVRSQHASMNVPDKEALYAEARRVLRGDVHLLLGGDYGAMFANRVRNLEEERIRILMGVWRRP